MRRDGAESAAPREGFWPRVATWAVALGLLFVGARLYLTPHDWSTLYLRDLKVYQAAIDAFAAGADPYQPALARRAHGLFFTAPPLVWLLYKLAAHSTFRPIVGPVLLAADIISVVALPVILSRLLLGPGAARTALGAGFFFIAFAGAGFFTALVINNGTPLYALIALGLVPAVTQGRWLCFHLAVALATAFKPFYAAFWLVPLLADGASARQWTASAIGLGVAASTYVAPVLVAPRLMSAWLHALLRQTVGERLLGDNLLGAVGDGSTSRPSHWAPYEAQLALSAALLGASLLLGRLHRTQRIAGLMLAATFLNPRAMRYDLSTAAIPLLAIVAGAFCRDAPTTTAQAAWAVMLAAVMIVFSRNTPADGWLYAGLAVAALAGAICASLLKPAGGDSRRA